MGKKVIRREVQDMEARLNAEVYNPPAPGRPGAPTPTGSSVVVTLGLLRQCWKALGRCAQALDSGPDHEAATDAMGALLKRIGPALDTDEPVHKLARGRPAQEYEVTWPDGQTERAARLEDVAKLVGSTRGSLAVSLSKGKGQAKRRLFDQTAREYFHVRIKRLAGFVPESDTVPE